MTLKVGYFIYKNEYYDHAYKENIKVPPFPVTELTSEHQLCAVLADQDMLLQELAKRIFPLCESFMLINHFVESRSQFKNGLVNHAFAAALRALLLVCFLVL